MDFPRTLSLISRQEGLKLICYDDATGQPIVPGYRMKGRPSIGYGHNLLDAGITYQQADDLLNSDLDVAISLSQSLSWFSKLNDARQAVIVSMVFNLGLGKFLNFKRLIEALEQGNFKLAAKEMLDSDWARQVGRRASELSDMMLSGEF